MSVAPDFKFRWHQGITRSDLPPTTKLVAYALWEYTNQFGQNAHPGNSRLAIDTSTSVPTIKRHLKILRDGHWIVRTVRSTYAPDRTWADVYALGPTGIGDHLGDPLSDTREILATEQTRDQSEQTRDQTEPTRDHLGEPPKGLCKRFEQQVSSDSDESASSWQTNDAEQDSSLENKKDSDPPDNWIDDWDAVDDWLTAHFWRLSEVRLSAVERTVAWSLWKEERHPKEIYNAILKHRKEKGLS